MATLDDVKNFAIGVVSQGYDSAATSIVLQAGQGVLFPDPPFNVIWWNDTTYKNPALDPSREIVRVTGKNVDTLTVVRGQETADGGLSASAKNLAGVVYRVAQQLTAKTIGDIESKAVDIGLIVFASEKGATGDGVTDDTDALQDAIDAGNEIVLPPGTYLVGANVLGPKSNLTIRGSGPGATTIKLKNSAGFSAIFRGTGSALSNITIRDLTLDGNVANNPTNGAAISIDEIDGLLIDNVEIKDFRGRGITLGDQAGGAGIKNVLIRGSRITNCESDLIRIYNKGSANVGNKILGCTLSTPAAAGGGINAINVYGPIVIADCAIEGITSQTRGIWLQKTDGTNGAGAHGAQVSNCRIKGTAHATDISRGMLIEALRVHVANVEVDGTDYGFEVSAADGDDCVMTACSSLAADRGFYIVGDRAKLQGCYTSGAAVGIRIDSSAGDTLISHCHIAAGTTKVDNQSTTTHTVGQVAGMGWVTESQVESGDTATDSTGTKDFTIAHLLDVTPAVMDVNLSMRYTSSQPATAPNVRGPFMKLNPTSTNILITFDISTAGTAGSTMRIVAHVHALP